jgi:hypothetical protein
MDQIQKEKWLGYHDKNIFLEKEIKDISQFTNY